MNISTNSNQMYKQHIEYEKAQTAKMGEAAKTVADPKVRAYLEASNKVMRQLDQLDEFVFTSTTQKKPKGFFEKVKAFFHK